jgi:hypothetical protein
VKTESKPRPKPSPRANTKAHKPRKPAKSDSLKFMCEAGKAAGGLKKNSPEAGVCPYVFGR